MERIYNFRVQLDWSLVSLLSGIDRFDAYWNSVIRSESKSLKELKAIATVRSVGASTRIEGSTLKDDEVDYIIRTLDIQKLEERDSQEVAGYFEVLDLITSSFEDIAVSENAIKDLHNRLLKYSAKDDWHRGEYKQHSNRVEATMSDGSKQVIFETALPGFVTSDAVKNLIKWYNTDDNVHPLVKTALFAYEFLSIHPFQDGNGRLSRLMSTLLLLRTGYSWIEYISFEHEIENRKHEYYSVLRSCQSQRPDEDVTSWIFFFLNCLQRIQLLLKQKISSTGEETQISSKEKSVLTFIREHPGIQSGEIAERLIIPNPTVKRILAGLVERGLIEREGVGRGTVYF